MTMPLTHYRAAVYSDVACGAEPTVGQSLSTTEYLPFVTCPDCRNAEGLCAGCGEPLKMRDRSRSCFSCQQQAAEV